MRTLLALPVRRRRAPRSVKVADRYNEAQPDEEMEKYRMQAELARGDHFFDKGDTERQSPRSLR